MSPCRQAGLWRLAAKCIRHLPMGTRIVLILSLFALLGLTGCGALGVTVKAKLDRAGVVGAEQARPATDPKDVQVFLLSGPEGFTLADNELGVEEGYAHEVIGLVKVVTDDGGFCDVGPLVTAVEERGRDAILDLMRERAARAGANAVIYATSELGEDADGDDLCKLRAQQLKLRDIEPWAAGWAVVIGPQTTQGGESPEAAEGPAATDAPAAAEPPAQ